MELLFKAGADANIGNHESETPLHRAAEDGAAIECLYLIEHGAKVQAENCRKQTPLHYAAANAFYEVVELLIDYGAEVNSKDFLGKSPLHYAIYGNITRHQLTDHLRTAEILILAGADLQAKTNEEETPLQLARQHFGYPELEACYYIMGQNNISGRSILTAGTETLIRYYRCGPLP